MGLYKVYKDLLLYKFHYTILFLKYAVHFNYIWHIMASCMYGIQCEVLIPKYDMEHLNQSEIIPMILIT